MIKEMNLMKKLGFDEIIEYSLKLYKKNFFYFIKIFAYYYVPAIIIMVLYKISFINNYQEFMMDFINKAGGPNASPFAAFSYMFSLFKQGALAGVLYGLLYFMASFALIKAIHEKVAGGNSTVSQLLVHPLKKIFHILITYIFIIFPMLIVGTMLCFFPVIILAVYMSFIVQIMMVEDKFYFNSIGRSFSLVNNFFWSTLLIPLVYYFFYAIVSSIISYAGLMGPYVQMFKDIIQNKGQTDPTFMVDFMTKSSGMFVIITVLSYLVQWLLTPILFIAMTMKYNNIKNLKEGTLLLDEINKEKGTPSK